MGFNEFLFSENFGLYKAFLQSLSEGRRVLSRINVLRKLTSGQPEVMKKLN